MNKQKGDKKLRTVAENMERVRPGLEKAATISLKSFEYGSLVAALHLSRFPIALSTAGKREAEVEQLVGMIKENKQLKVKIVQELNGRGTNKAPESCFDVFSKAKGRDFTISPREIKGEDFSLRYPIGYLEDESVESYPCELAVLTASSTKITGGKAKSTSNTCETVAGLQHHTLANMHHVTADLFKKTGVDSAGGVSMLKLAEHSYTKADIKNVKYFLSMVLNQVPKSYLASAKQRKQLDKGKKIVHKLVLRQEKGNYEVDRFMSPEFVEVKEKYAGQNLTDDEKFIHHAHEIYLNLHVIMGSPKVGRGAIGYNAYDGIPMMREHRKVISVLYDLNRIGWMDFQEIRLMTTNHAMAEIVSAHRPPSTNTYYQSSVVSSAKVGAIGLQSYDFLCKNCPIFFVDPVKMGLGKYTDQMEKAQASVKNLVNTAGTNLFAFRATSFLASVKEYDVCVSADGSHHMIALFSKRRPRIMPVEIEEEEKWQDGEVEPISTTSESDGSIEIDIFAEHEQNNPSFLPMADLVEEEKESGGNNDGDFWNDFDMVQYTASQTNHASYYFLNRFPWRLASAVLDVHIDDLEFKFNKKIKYSDVITYGADIEGMFFHSAKEIVGVLQAALATVEAPVAVASSSNDVGPDTSVAKKLDSVKKPKKKKKEKLVKASILESVVYKPKTGDNKPKKDH